jgi:hypothetical protein
LTGRRIYLDQTESLIRRCVHPTDDLAALDLLNAELRWSYPVFLVALARYLRVKAEADMLDHMYAYGQASFLHYATWMVENERPYFHHREQLEFPTETWPAQEFRKANALRLAAAHADQPLCARLLRRGQDLADRAWNDFLSFDSRHLARPVAIMMTEGTRDQFFRRHLGEPAPRSGEAIPFEQPMRFASQKQRVKALLRSPAKLTANLALRIRNLVAAKSVNRD